MTVAAAALVAECVANMRGSQDCNNLHDAAKLGLAGAAVRLLAAPGASEAVNSKDKLKRMPLHLAAWAGSVDVTKLLVGHW